MSSVKHPAHRDKVCFFVYISIISGDPLFFSPKYTHSYIRRHLPAFRQVKRLLAYTAGINYHPDYQVVKTVNDPVRKAECEKYHFYSTFPEKECRSFCVRFRVSGHGAHTLKRRSSICFTKTDETFVTSASYAVITSTLTKQLRPESSKSLLKVRI